MNAPKKNKPPFFQVTDQITLIFQDSIGLTSFNTCNSYLLKLNEINDKAYAIIDPGCSKKKLNTTLKSLGISYSDLKYIYLTHGHCDHVNLVDFLQEKNPNIEVFISELDRKLVESAQFYYQNYYNIPLLESNAKKYQNVLNTIDFYSGTSEKLISPEFKLVFDMRNVKNRKIDHTFKAGEVLPGNLKIIHAPGHSPGMCLFYKEQDKILFTADIDLIKNGADVSSNFSVIWQFKESINKIIDMVKMGELKTVLSGHGKNPITENLESRLNLFYNCLIEKENRVLNLLKQQSMSLEELTTETFKFFLKRFENIPVDKTALDGFKIAEVSEMVSNLNILKELECLKKVKKAENEYWSLE